MRKFHLPLTALCLSALLSMDLLAALNDKPFMDSIHDTVAVLRWYHKQRYELQANNALVVAARELTERQQAALQSLVATERARDPESPYITQYENDLKRLDGHMAKLIKLNYEETYKTRMAAIQTEESKMRASLEARLREYEALFGSRPRVDLDFERSYERFGIRHEDAGLILRLD